MFTVFLLSSFTLIVAIQVNYTLLWYSLVPYGKLKTGNPSGFETMLNIHTVIITGESNSTNIKKLVLNLSKTTLFRHLLVMSLSLIKYNLHRYTKLIARHVENR